MVRNMSFAVGRWAVTVTCALVIALLAGCAAPTVVEPQAATGPYKVDLQIDPITLNPPQTGTLTFAIKDNATGKALTTLERVSGALMHIIVLSRDLVTFRHSYTEELVDSKASLFTYFPASSSYHVYGLYKPAGAEIQTYRADIRLTGQEGDPPRLVEEASLHKTAGWLSFDLLKQQGAIKSGTPTQLAFYLSERGRPVTALWQYLGAPGHLWIVDENGESFAHVEGSAASSGAAGGQSGSSTAGSSSAGGTGGTGAAGAGAAGTRSGLGTPEASVPAQPSPTFGPGLGQALATVVAVPTQQLAAVQETAQSSILGTPEVVPAPAYGPVIAFTHTFPHAGLYKMWLEVYYRGQPILIDYVLRVE